MQFGSARVKNAYIEKCSESTVKVLLKYYESTMKVQWKYNESTMKVCESTANP
jgi:hypothetical protein